MEAQCGPHLTRARVEVGILGSSWVPISLAMGTVVLLSFVTSAPYVWIWVLNYCVKAKNTALSP